MTVDELFQHIEEHNDDLQLDAKHGALLAIGVGDKSSCVVRGIGKNVIVAIAMAMNDDYRVAELLNAAVKLYNDHKAKEDTDEFAPLRKVFKVLDKA